MDKQPTILVVDDVRTNVLLIAGLLHNDYKILKAYSGEEALEIQRRDNPDLILLDVVMPDMDGYEVCRRIKAENPNTFIPIIFLSARDDMDSKETGLLSGAEDFIAKPVEIAELRARIKALLWTKSLYGELAEAHAEIERERDAIARIQKDLLPAQPPSIPGFRFFCDYQPSSKAGGDYYDFIPIGDRHLGIIVCDVSGHGSPAAVIMAMTRIVLRVCLSETLSPREALEELNRILFREIDTSGFISAFYGVIDLPARKMKYASAGHNPAILLDYRANRHHLLSSKKGFPLKIALDNPMEENEIALPKGCKLAFYTDGITEAMNAERELFGIERLAAALLELGKNWSAERLGREVMKIIYRGLRY